MEFTREEERFLLRAQRERETADTAGRSYADGQLDMRQLGAPDWLIRKVCEHRAKKMGAKFLEFRAAAQKRAAEAATAPASDLDVRVQASKLF